MAVDVSHSTQFASGLLMAAPYAKTPLTLVVEGDRQQIPYVDMSAAVMGQFGVALRREGSAFPVPQGRYKSPGDYLVEPDLSAAAYFFAAATLIGGKVTILGTQAQAMQGDIRFLKVLQHLGASFYQDEHGLTLEKDPSTPLKGGVTVDMNAFSDQALTLAALAPFATGPITVKNVAHTRKQECDRIQAAVENLKLLGIQAEEQADGFTIHPASRRAPRCPAFGDHRVAMAFGLVGLKVPGVSIQDPGCVAKTFADYWTGPGSFPGGARPCLSLPAPSSPSTVRRARARAPWAKALASSAWASLYIDTGAMYRCVTPGRPAPQGGLRGSRLQLEQVGPGRSKIRLEAGRAPLERLPGRGRGGEPAAHARDQPG